MRESSSRNRKEAAFEVINGAGSAPFVIVCEHASNFIPDDFKGLGLDGAGQNAHVAWDPGALGIARRMASVLGAPLVASRMSRLLHDCNRPPASPEAMPAQSEEWIIPGNAGLTEKERQSRAQRFYMPFHQAVTQLFDRFCSLDVAPALVTVHTFTPIYYGVARDVEVGILHDSDTRLADALLSRLIAGSMGRVIRRNEPYGPQHGVTHTLRVHALPRGLLNVMIEIRNDLVVTTAQQEAMGTWLAAALGDALFQGTALGAERGRQASVTPPNRTAGNALC